MDTGNNSNPRAEKPSVAATLDALQAGEDAAISATVFYGLSGLTEAELAEIAPVWGTLSPEYRLKIAQRLGDVAEVNFELDYRAFGRFALDDSDAAVREAAIELLFEDLSIGLMDRLIELAQWDEAPQVRAAAASALGRFILAGELEDLPESETTRAQDAAVSLWSNEDEDVDVRRRALEAIANCSHEIVPEAIEEAYHSGERRLRVSAVFAMGRTYAERWTDYVLHEIDSDDAELRFEATRAAGELELRQAVPVLVRLAQGKDREIMETAIWSLGEIGGTDAARALNALARKAEQTEDDELLEAIEDALMAASLVNALGTDSDEWDD